MLNVFIYQLTEAFLRFALGQNNYPLNSVEVRVDFNKIISIFIEKLKSLLLAKNKLIVILLLCMFGFYVFFFNSNILWRFILLKIDQ